MKRLLLLCLTACVALGASASVASARPLVGVQGISAAGPAADYALARSAGARVTRIEARWSLLEPDGPGRVNTTALAALDATVDAAARRGIKVILVVDSTPCWASAAPDDVKQGCVGAAATSDEVTRYRPADPSTAVPIMAQLSGRYGKRLAAFQVWNEPDQANERYWAGPNKVATYVQLVKAAYAPLKQANPGVPVIAGSFVGGNGAWLKAMYAAGVKGSYDGLAVQFYAATLDALRTTRQVQLAAGDRTPLWLTEWGANSCLRRETAGMPTDQPCVSRGAQARVIGDVLAAISRRSWIKAAVLYELRDQPRGYQLGLVDQAGKRKAAFATFRRYARGSRSRPRRPTIRSSFTGGRTVLSGTATTTEPLTLRIARGSQSQRIAGIRADGKNRWSYALPAAFGSASGLSFRVTGAWTGSSPTIRR